MQQNILTRHKDADLAVYAVWFSMWPSDSRERWPPDLLTDSRVVHYWDERKNVGTWYGERLHEMASSLAPDSVENEGPILWDVYLVYGPEARWNDVPTGLRRWGRTILKTQESLRQSVAELVSKP